MKPTDNDITRIIKASIRGHNRALKKLGLGRATPWKELTDARRKCYFSGISLAIREWQRIEAEKKTKRRSRKC